MRKLGKPVMGVLGVVLLGRMLLGFAGCFIDRWPDYHALMNAISDHNEREVTALLARGVDPNHYPPPSHDEDDQAPINAAVDTGNIEIVKLLLNAGADIQATDPWGGPPLEVAARNGDMEMLQYLVERNAKVNDEPTGSSALYGAAVEGRDDAVRFLLAHGANPWTSLGYDAKGAASEFGHQNAAQLLEEARKNWPSIATSPHRSKR